MSRTLIAAPSRTPSLSLSTAHTVNSHSTVCRCFFFFFFLVDLSHFCVALTPHIIYIFGVCLFFLFFNFCMFFSFAYIFRWVAVLASGLALARTFQWIVLITYKNWHSTSLGWEKEEINVKFGGRTRGGGDEIESERLKSFFFFGI